MTRAELHFHLLPGIDDGPVTMEDAVALARLAVADGTGVVTVTPHVRDLLRDELLGQLPRRVAAVRDALRAAGVPLEVRTGAELAQEDVAFLVDDELDAIAQGPDGARWVLIEAPLFGGDGEAFVAATAAVRARGFGTLIGHPERASGFMRLDGAVERELRAGAVLQVNASSLTGEHGGPARQWGIELIRSGRATVVASDAHRVTRPPRLGEAVAVLAGAGVRDAERLVSAAPLALLERGLAAVPRVRAA
jgi:protein-tyrosine phosphatase